ncbi:FecR family protein [Dyadobacter diqingensis]|uniref:FecR family protein n=1 Tax=Dyadobacter diqingensis TaxID=2938121 RepID=UPI0020C42403|nr:FecR domain-containing protein [Dyadobacter diqingensis]
MEAPILKHILFEYLSGRANPLERQLAEDWLKDAENTDTFHQWLYEWETRSPQFIPDQEQAMMRLLSRINNEEPKPEADINEDDQAGSGWSPFQLRKYWLIAASILLLVCCSWFSRDVIQYKTFETGYGQTTKLYLEDGSRVALNANSRLKIPRFGFFGDVRTVSLDGEAEFSVSHTIDHKRFVVRTSDTFQVEVLGTQFSVFARPRGTKVALSHGKIRIDYSQGEKHQHLLMKPGDLATLQKTGAVQLVNDVDTKSLSAWKEQRFVFNATSLLEISNLIQENFGKKVRIANDKIARRTITGNFKTQNAEELLRTVSEVLDLEIETAGDSILITDN